jgi:hypothetical protein
LVQGFSPPVGSNKSQQVVSRQPEVETGIVKACDVFYLPPGWRAPAKLHSVQVNHEETTRIGRQVAVSITRLEQKMTQIKIAVISPALVHFTRYNRHLFD